ncbi:MAG: MBL fold metallo-hydrolase [Bacillota bacterium]
MDKKAELVGQDDQIELFRLETEPFGTNAYIIICRESGESVLIDTPGNPEVIIEKLKNTRLKYILMTHGHTDHVMALRELYAAMGVPLAVHEGDAGKLPVKADILLRDGNTLEFGKLRLEVIHTPGHTPGSLCFRIGKYLLSGDTIFPGGPGKTDTPRDFNQILESIQENLLTLPDETVILPGHGDATTLEKERKLIEAFISRVKSDDLCGDVTWNSS